MNPLKPRVPEGAKVYSFLYPPTDPEYLTQDVLAVSLPNGFYIDVGWFPEHDPDGCYVVRVFYQHWDAQHILPIRAKTVDDVIQVVERLAERFNANVVTVSSSSALVTNTSPPSSFSSSACTFRAENALSVVE